MPVLSLCHNPPPHVKIQEKHIEMQSTGWKLKGYRLELKENQMTIQIFAGKALHPILKVTLGWVGLVMDISFVSDAFGFHA